jgi:hypothetical protein
MSNRKLMVAYVGLVGIPLLGLMGILHAGQRLRAPIALGGNWNVEADFSPWSGKPCGGLLGAGKQPLLAISQSGERLLLTLNNPEETVLAGSIRGTALSAGPDEASAPAGGQCTAGQAIDMAGEVSQDGEGRALTGVFRLNGCQECAPVSFHAVRQAAPKRGEQ